MQQITSCGDDTNTLQDIIDGLDCTLPCDVATANTAAALAVYEVTDAASSDFAMVCNEYQRTLEQQIESCGDDTNTLQAIIDGLDCGAVVITPGVCQTCTGGGLPSATYCDNGNGTMDITTNGTTTTTSLNGFDFDFYIQALVTSGATCN
jgi:Cys-tRNA synthase (O-phospho-L-seryl-tRNA:Cys-tRNA synthase)